MISQDNNGEKKKFWPKFERQTNIEIMVNVLRLLSIGPLTLNELVSKKRISSKKMKTYLGFLFVQGLIIISKTNQGNNLTTVFSLTQQGIKAERSFRPLEENSQIEFESEVKKWASSKLVVRN